MSGLFSIFNLATRGMTAQQTAINTASHNIANANTEGYSRQRATIETSRPSNTLSLNSVFEPGQLGTGAQVSSIQRIRDSFLDYQVRNENSSYGQYSIREQFLSEVESILNEPSDTGISSLMGEFFDSWQILAKDAENSNSRTIAAQQAAALADALNHTANQLQKLKENAQINIKDSVFEINDTLNQIDKLNQQIIGVKISGQEPNDLMDKRDLLIDGLSKKFNLTVVNKDFEGVDIKPENLISNNAGDNSSFIKSQNNDTSMRLSYVDSITKNDDGTYNITYYKLGDKTRSLNAETIKNVTLSDDEYKSLDECRVIWAKNDGTASTIENKDGSEECFVLFQPSSGELQGYASIQEDIDGYMSQLDNLAKALAFSVNALHSGKESASEDYMPFFVNSNVADGLYKGSVLYDGMDDSNLKKVTAAEKDITAANISVNKQIIEDVMQIKTKLNDDKYKLASDNTEDGSDNGARALAIAQLRDSLINIQNIGSTILSREDLFDLSKGNNDIVKNNEGTVEFVSSSNGMTLEDYFKDVVDKLGVQGSQASRMVANQETLLSSFEESRQSISGVSIDEEMANLIQYQHAYQANAKVISTVNQLLDVVINGLIK